MAITGYGFGDTVEDPEQIDAPEWSKMFGAASAPVVRTATAFRVSAIAGERSVTIAGDGAEAIHQGVLAVGAGNESIGPFPAPAGWRHDAVVLRYDWDSGTISPVRLSGPTYTAAPTSTPAVVPATFRDNPGVSSDQLLAWVLVNSANNTLRVTDMRRLASAPRVTRNVLAVETGSLINRGASSVVAGIASDAQIATPFYAEATILLLLPSVPSKGGDTAASDFAYGGTVYLATAESSDTVIARQSPVPGRARWHTHQKAWGPYYLAKEVVVKGEGVLQPGEAVKVVLQQDATSFGTFEFWDVNLTVTLNPDGPANMLAKATP